MKSWLLYFFAIFATVVFLPFAADKAVGEEERYSVTVETNGSVCELPLEEFVLRVLAAEGESVSEPENIKALAVAIRSTARYASLKGLNHSDFDFCDDPGCCFALASAEDATETERLAAEETRGRLLTYGGTPAFAPFCLCAGSGTTEREGFDMLSAVSEESPCELHKQVSEHPYGGLFTENKKSAFVYDGHGKCVFAVADGRYVTAEEIIAEYGLASSEFKLEFGEKGIVSTVYGVGNGLGLSLCGGERLAEDGEDFEEILKKYFPKTVLSE